MLILFTACGSNVEQEGITPKEAKAIAKEAFIFGYPIVMNYKTMYEYYPG